MAFQWGRHIVKKAFATLVFALFEPEKFNKHKQKQRSTPTVSAWVSCCLFLVQVSQDLKSGTAATDTPLFLWYVAKKVKCYIPIPYLRTTKKPIRIAPFARFLL
jgi:hypothetical protein